MWYSTPISLSTGSRPHATGNAHRGRAQENLWPLVRGGKSKRLGWGLPKLGRVHYTNQQEGSRSEKKKRNATAGGREGGQPRVSHSKVSITYDGEGVAGCAKKPRIRGDEIGRGKSRGNIKEEIVDDEDTPRIRNLWAKVPQATPGPQNHRQKVSERQLDGETGRPKRAGDSGAGGNFEKKKWGGGSRKSRLLIRVVGRQKKYGKKSHLEWHLECLTGKFIEESTARDKEKE